MDTRRGQTLLRLLFTHTCPVLLFLFLHFHPLYFIFKHSHFTHIHSPMCRLWGTTTLALSWATLLCAAYPQPQLWSQNQQIPFSSHLSNDRLSPNFNNHQTPDVFTYARFDDEQVLRVDVTDLAQLKQLEQTVEVMNEFCRNIPSALLFRF